MQASRLKRALATLAAVLLTATLATGCGTRGGSQGTPPGGSSPPQAPGARQPTLPTQPGTPPQPTAHPAPVSSSLIRQNGIAIREFPLAERPDNIEAFNRLPADVQEDWGDKTHGMVDSLGQRLPSLGDVNDALQAWGFSLKPGEPTAPGLPAEYQLVRGDQTVAKLSFIRDLSRSADGRRAVFVAEGSNGRSFIFLDGKFEDWNAFAADYVPPVFVGNSLYSLTRAGDNAGEPQTYSALKEGQARPVYTFKAMFYTASPIHGFYSTGDGWVLEYSDHVVVNGQDLGAQKGYSKVFLYRKLAGQPFYLFEQNGRIQMSFAGETLTPQYDEVLHNQCCEPAIANPWVSEIAARFFARHGDQWYYVSALVPAD